MGCSFELTPRSSNAKTKSYLDSHQLQTLGDHLQNLSADNMKGRKFATTGSIVAQHYISSSLIASNVQPFQQKYNHNFDHNTLFSTKVGTNIIGWVKGTQYPEKYIILSAHYDHLGMKGTKIYNGADDNASGTAALLTFGKIIAKTPLKHSVIFLFTDGEEVNILGAKAFTIQQKALLPNIILNINLDMIAGNSNTKKLHYIDKRLETILTENKLEMFHKFSEHSSSIVKRNFRRELYRGNNRNSWNNASDHAAFMREDIPFIYYGVGEHTTYHTTDDDFAHINMPFFEKAFESIFYYLTFLDQHIKSFEQKPD